MENKIILIVAAHPDDEILGCGGTIAKLKKNNDIYTTILGEGISSRNENAVTIKIEKLKDECLKAHQTIGIKNVFFDDLPDNSFDKLPLLEVVKKVCEYMQKINPDVIFTHHHADLNIDHRITFQAVLTCCRPQPGFKHPDIYSFEIPSSTDWQVMTEENVFKPNVFIDISSTIDLKLRALKCYKSEMREFPHSRSLKGVKIMAQNWGRKVGKEYVEAFELIRSIKDNL